MLTAAFMAQLPSTWKVPARMAWLDPTILADLKRDGLLRDGHFAFRTGHHSAGLVDRDRLLSDPLAASRMGYTIAKRFFSSHVETVAAPSIWGAGLAQWVAYFLEPKAKVVFATPTGDGITIAPNLEDLIRHRRVLLIDNLVVSGDTMHRFTNLVEQFGGEILGISTLWSCVEQPISGHTVFGLLNTDYPAFAPGRCPLCAAADTPQAPAY